MAVSDAAELMVARDWMSVPRQPRGPSVVLCPTEGQYASPALGMLKRLKRKHTSIDEHAKGEERGAADPMLAMDQDFPPLAKASADESDPSVQALDPQRVHVRRWKMQEVYPEFAKMLLLVAILLPKVDDRSDVVGARQLRRAFHGEAASDGQVLRQPVKIGLPWAARSLVHLSVLGDY